MADAEQALFLNHLPAQPPEGFSRLYFGAEFCFWRLSDCSDLIAARDWARVAGWDFTLVTPVLGEDERCRLEKVLSAVLPCLDAGDEVLISDWGALEPVRTLRDDLTIILGRTLAGQKRGPRILDMALSTEQRDYFQRGSWHNCHAVELLATQGIRRIEQDNLLQGLAPLPGGIKGSLHLPYVMVTSSRNCPFRPHGDSGVCGVHCGEVFSLQSTETGIPLVQDGNTQFLKNEIVPTDLAQLGIDRIVKHPEIA